MHSSRIAAGGGGVERISVWRCVVGEPLDWIMFFAPEGRRKSAGGVSHRITRKGGRTPDGVPKNAAHDSGAPSGAHPAAGGDPVVPASPRHTRLRLRSAAAPLRAAFGRRLAPLESPPANFRSALRAESARRIGRTCRHRSARNRRLGGTVGTLGGVPERPKPACSA